LEKSKQSSPHYFLSVVHVSFAEDDPNHCFQDKSNWRRYFKNIVSA